MLSLKERNLEYRCRRGTRELEVLLKEYLKNYYHQSSQRQQSIFQWLLSLEDDKLWDWIFQGHAGAARTPADELKQAIENYINQA